MTDKFARISAIGGYERDFINALHLIVVGAGAIGNELVKNLTLFGVRKITLLDFDTIELHNLTRSVFFSEDDVGQQKASTVALKANSLANEHVVDAVDKDFWTGLSFDAIRKADAVICAVDNFEARIKLNQLCNLLKKPFLNTAIDHRHVSIELFPFDKAGCCACFECAIPSSVYSKISERYSCGWIKKLHQEQKTIPTTSVTSSIVASICVSQLLEYLNPLLHRENIVYENSRKILFDTKSLNISETAIKPKESCPSGLHGKREFLMRGVNRNNLINELFIGIPEAEIANTSIRFSEPILLFTSDAGKVQKYIFKPADHFDENILMNDGVRSLNAEIVEELDLQELLTSFKDFPMPGKFVFIENKTLRYDLLMELQNE